MIKKKIKEYYIKKFKAKTVKYNFSYSSGNNSKFLKKNDLKIIIKKISNY